MQSRANYYHKNVQPFLLENESPLNAAYKKIEKYSSQLVWVLENIFDLKQGQRNMNAGFDASFYLKWNSYWKKVIFVKIIKFVKIKSVINWKNWIRALGFVLLILSECLNWKWHDGLKINFKENWLRYSLKIILCKFKGLFPPPFNIFKED